jgi:hypothetical protein
MKEPKDKQTPRIGRKDLQDPDRDIRGPRGSRGSGAGAQ